MLLSVDLHRMHCIPRFPTASFYKALLALCCSSHALEQRVSHGPAIHVLSTAFRLQNPCAAPRTPPTPFNAPRRRGDVAKPPHLPSLHQQITLVYLRAHRHRFHILSHPFTSFHILPHPSSSFLILPHPSVPLNISHTDILNGTTTSGHLYCLAFTPNEAPSSPPHRSTNYSIKLPL